MMQNHICFIWQFPTAALTAALMTFCTILSWPLHMSFFAVFWVRVSLCSYLLPYIISQCCSVPQKVGCSDPPEKLHPWLHDHRVKSSLPTLLPGLNDSPDYLSVLPMCHRLSNVASWPLLLLTPDIPALQTANFHEALFPTTIWLCELHSAFHLLCGFSYDGIATSGRHARTKTIPSGAALFLLLIFKCSCFKSSFSSLPWHAGSFSVYNL